MKFDSAMRVVNEKREGQGIPLRALDYHRDLPGLWEET
jgi:hypothetical protein